MDSVAANICTATSPDGPAGCLGVQGSLAAGDPGRFARDALIVWRVEGVLRLRDRLRSAVGEGDLPPDSDPMLLARYLMTVANGIAVQAVDGATEEELQLVADMALRSWPAV